MDGPVLGVNVNISGYFIFLNVRISQNGFSVVGCQDPIFRQGECYTKSLVLLLLSLMIVKTWIPILCETLLYNV